MSVPKKTKKVRYGYLAKCQADGWTGAPAKSEKEASKMYLAHALEKRHLEIRQVPVKHKVVVEVVEVVESS
jgi:hypothetical protein